MRGIAPDPLDACPRCSHRPVPSALRGNRLHRVGLSILSNQGSLMGMERFAKRHLQTLNDRLGADVAKPPSDSTFWLLLAVQPGVTESFDALVQI